MASIVICALNTSVSASNDGVDFGLDDLSFSSTTKTTALLSYGDLNTNVTIYPNPTANNVSIKIAEACTVALFDLREIKLIEDL